MGRSISKVFDRLLGKQEMKILILGLDCAGKTTILYKLKLGKIVETTPTIGFNVEMVEWKNIKFTVWDACSQERARRLWKHYAENTHGLIFVVDSSDKERIEEAKSEFQKMLDNDELRDAALLIFANKLDRKVMSVAEIAEKLELTKLKDRSWNIQGCSAVTLKVFMKALIGSVPLYLRKNKFSGMVFWAD